MCNGNGRYLAKKHGFYLIFINFNCHALEYLYNCFIIFVECTKSFLRQIGGELTFIISSNKFVIAGDYSKQDESSIKVTNRIQFIVEWNNRIQK